MLRNFMSSSLGLIESDEVYCPGAGEEFNSKSAVNLCIFCGVSDIDHCPIRTFVDVLVLIFYRINHATYFYVYATV